MGDRTRLVRVDATLIPHRAAVDILYLLIPFSVLLVLALMALFAWALHTDQFDDLQREGERILGETDSGFDADQASR